MPESVGKNVIEQPERYHQMIKKLEREQKAGEERLGVSDMNVALKQAHQRILKQERPHEPLAEEDKEIKVESKNHEIIQLKNEQVKEINNLAKLLGQNFTPSEVSKLKGRVSFPEAPNR